MFDEHEEVFQTVAELSKINCKIFLIQSDDGSSRLETYDVYHKSKLSNLESGLDDKRKLGSSCICRNMSAGFSKAYATARELEEIPQLVIGVTGDTLITDSFSFVRRFNQMQKDKKLAMVSQAWGQTFWGREAILNRPQGEWCADFACCLFLVDGKFFIDTACFTNIKIINEYTSEECLGTELVKHLPEGNFREHISLLNTNPYAAYSYNDGVVYHARNGKPGR